MRRAVTLWLVFVGWLLAIDVTALAAGEAESWKAMEFQGPIGLHFNCEQMFGWNPLYRYTSDAVIFGAPLRTWTPDVVDFLKSAVDQCTAAGRLGNDMNLAAKRHIDDVAAIPAQERAEAGRRAADLEEQRRQARQVEEFMQAARESQRIQDQKDAAARAAAEAKQRNYRECVAGAQHALYAAQESVLSHREALARARKSMATEKRIEAESGVQDLVAARNLGTAVVTAEDALTDAFSEYRRLGGTAADPGGVSRSITDPCAALR
jgi:hypothetical protein